MADNPNMHTSDPYEQTAVPLDLSQLDPTNSRSKFMNKLTTVDGAICGMDESMPVLVKSAVEKVRGLVSLTYDWSDTNTPFAVDVLKFNSKVLHPHPFIIGVNIGKTGLNVLVKDPFEIASPPGGSSTNGTKSSTSGEPKLNQPLVLDAEEPDGTEHQNKKRKRD